MRLQGYVIIGMAALSLCGCSRIERSAKQPSVIRVETMVVEGQTGVGRSRYVGVVEAVRETPLSMQTTGRILRLACRDGQRVRKGQILVEVDSTQAVNGLRSAEASLHHAEDGYARAKQVHEKGGVTDQQMVEIESQLTQAQSVYNASLRRVEECTLRAPFDGVVSGCSLSEGQSVTPGVKLFALLDISALTVRFGVPEGEINGIGSAEGEVEVPAVDTVLPIRITDKSVRANPVTHSYEVSARIDGGAGVLMPGMVGKVRLVESQKSKVESRLSESGSGESGEIVIPANCVLLMPQGATVWVVEDGKAQRRAVTIDGYLANGVRIREGLKIGDTLVVEGYQKLYRGSPVKGE